MAELLRAVESNILLASDTTTLDYRSAQMAQCSMTGVAAALVAQVASSSLQLQYMPTIHWIVPALCTGSLVIGLLCVYYSFLLHYSLAKYACARDLRTAFAQRAPIGTVGTAGTARGGGGGGDEGEERRERGGGGEGGEGAGVGGTQLEEGIAERVEEGGGRRLPSYQATLILWLPFYLLMLAISLYLATLFLYWWVAAATDLQGSWERSRKVGFQVWTSLEFQSDNGFLGPSIHRTGIMRGCISMGCGNGGIGGITGLSSLHSGAVHLT